MEFPFHLEPGYMCLCILACTKICATTSVPIFTVLTLFFRFFSHNHSANRSSIYFSSFVTDICQKGKLKSMNCCLFLWREAWDGISLLFGTRIYVSLLVPGYMCLCILACTNICATTSVPMFTVLTLLFRFFLDNHSANCLSIYLSTFGTQRLFSGSHPGPLLNKITTIIFYRTQCL